MKRIISLISVFLCLCMLCACTTTDNSSSEPSDSSTITEVVYDYESEEEQTSSKPDTTTSAEASSQQTATVPESSQVTSSIIIGNNIKDTPAVARTPEALLLQLEIGKYEYRDEITGYNLPYSLILPKNYDASKKYPVLFYLHGAGERGSDNKIHLKNMMGDLYFYSGEYMFNAIVVCPQCPADDWWNLNYNGIDNEPRGALGAAMRLLFNVMDNYSADRDRLYVMGLSMGGFATWTVLEYFGDIFAAGVPICGWSEPSYAPLLVDIPIWIYHGTSDGTIAFEKSEEMYKAIREEGGEKVRFTRLYGVDHDAWDHADKDTQMIEWLFSQKLSDR